MNITTKQAQTILAEIQSGAEVNKISVHPYSGVATLSQDRETVVMIEADGMVTYRPHQRAGVGETR